LTSSEINGPRPALLFVLDGIRPDVLQAAIREGDAPNLGALAQRGEAVWDAVSVFPSITPAATAAIATGEAPARSGIVGHAWYDEDERRVVVYGAMTETVMASGPIRVFHNNVWRMNRDDLHAATLFEALHDRGFDGACVNFPVRRGPHTHPIRMKTVERYIKGGRYLGPSVQGPKEYFMGDLFYSRDTGFSGRRANGGVLRSVGINDDYAARVGAMLLKERAAPFNLVYFFKGDSIAHHHGLEAQRQWLATADEYVARIFKAGGGAERVLEEYAVLALSDHGHAPLLPQGRYVDLRLIPGHNVSSGVKARFGNGTTVVVVPNGRSALLYLRGDVELGSVVEKLAGRRGVDLAAWMEEGWVAVHRLGREVRFKPGSGPRDPFGRSWEIEGDPRALDFTVYDGFVHYGEYPDALERLWGCLHSLRCGDVVLSATPGYTFGEISGGYHTASDHGSLHASDSNVFVLASGVPAPHRITDVAPTLLSHFGAGTISEDRVLQ
jgi:Type I phosphodiesterase / nucleotide pyrophosphatase